MPKKIKKTIEVVLNAGVALRAYQQQAIEMIEGIRNNEKNDRKSPDKLYKDFYEYLEVVEAIVKKYPCETSVDEYNHIIECIEIYQQKDNPHFRDLSKKTIEDFTR